MRTFHFFIEDERYTVPTLAIVTVRDERRALELARQRLEESPHHLAVEVCEDDASLARIVRDRRTLAASIPSQHLGN
jgi:hypothetical protein